MACCKELCDELSDKTEMPSGDHQAAVSGVSPAKILRLRGTRRVEQ